MTARQIYSGTAVASTVLAVLVASGCGDSKPSSSLADHSTDVAGMIGASSCASSGFFVGLRADNSRLLVYNCDVDGQLICVTERAGVASDSTELVREVSTGALNGKPSCLGG